VPDDLATARAEVRQRLLDAEALVRASAGGALRGKVPVWQRVEMRPVELRDSARLQVVTFDERQSFTTNYPWGSEAEAVVDDLLDEPFGHWHVTSADGELGFRVTKSGRVLTTRSGTGQSRRTEHDRAKRRMVDPAAQFLVQLGVSDSAGHVKKNKTDKYRQVEQFVRVLDAAVRDARGAGRLDRGALHVVDLGCGNAYLTFAMYHHLHDVLGLEVVVTGVDVKEQARRHNVEVAEALGWQDAVTFVEGEIGSVQLAGPIDVTVALHACDTATDDALARAVGWGSDLILAAPCCQHDLQRQLKGGDPPGPYRLLTRNPLMRERWADLLTDTLRAQLLRGAGYRADIVEFVDSRHTPKNVLIRAHRTGAAPTAAEQQEYWQLVADWGVRPCLQELLAEGAGPGDAGDYSPR
jgi:SAM-dependent methyltransferase